MARIGVTFDQVKAVVDALEGHGKHASIQAVREALGGTGSPNTIHKHLVALRESRPVAVSAPQELPADLVNAFSNELSKAAARARAAVEGALVQAQAEAADLSAAGESLETQLADLTEQMIVTATERDAATATAAAHAGEIARLVSEVERERALAGAAQTEAATTRLRIDASAEKLAMQTVEIERLTAALKTADLVRQEAEKAAAVALAKLDAQSEARAAAEARALQAVKDGQERAASVTADFEARLQQAMKDGQGRAASITADLEALKKDLSSARDETKKSLQEAAELRGKLASVNVATVTPAVDNVEVRTNNKV